MLPLFRAFSALLALGGAVTPGLAAEWRLPPLTGQLAGEFTPVKLAGAPTLHWTLALENPAPAARVASLTADGTDTHVRAEVQMDAGGDGTWRLTEGRVGLKSWLGGQLTAGDVGATGEGTLLAGAMAGGLTLRLSGVDLGELLRFADADKKYFRAAEGRVAGTIRVTFAGGTFALGECTLALADGTIGLVSFFPNPGLLTGNVPAQVRKLYPGLEAIELGRTPLEARVLRLSVRTTPDEAGRRAFVRLEGRPHDPKLFAPLEIDINVTAELERVVRNLLAMRLTAGGAK